MKNVVFFIGSLQAGGTEAKLARNFIPRLRQRGKVTPKLLLLQERGEFLDILPDGIEILSLRETEKSSFFRLLPRFRDALRALRADIVVSCMWYPAIIAYGARRFRMADFKHIVHDTTTMTEYIKYEFANEKFKTLKLYLMKKAYADAERVIVVSQGEKKDLVKHYGIPEKLVQVIYNPIDSEAIRAMAAEHADVPRHKPVIVSVGRLIHSKGFDVLLKAFSHVRKSVDCTLLIIGDGVEKTRLKECAASLDISGDVVFAGFTRNPFKYMNQAHLFCTATRYEGLGNAIIEAMALGLPVIATDCRSGPGETLGGGKYGILVPPEDDRAFAGAMIQVLSDHSLRESLSRCSRERAGYFGPDALMKQWEDAILSA